MDFIKQWTLNISITVILATMLSLIAPKGNIGRFFRITLGMFILVSFLYPLSDNADISFPDFEIAEIEESEGNAYNNLIKTEIDQSLKAGGYDSCLVSCNLSVTGDEIYINSAEVAIPASYSKEEVKNYIFENLGLVTEVYYIGE